MLKRRINNYRIDHNKFMGKSIDKAIIILLSIITAFLLFSYIADSYFTGIICTALLACIVSIFIVKNQKRSPKDSISKREFVRRILLEGNGYLTDIFSHCIGNSYTIVKDGDSLILTAENKSILIYPAYKFGSLSEEDIAKSYRIAVKHNSDKIFVLTNHTERKALAISEYIPQKISIISVKTLYGFLAKKELLPQKTINNKKRKIGIILKECISYSNIKFFLFAAFSTAFVAFFTPFKLYYIIFACINVLLAFLTLLFAGKGQNERDFFI